MHGKPRYDFGGDIDLVDERNPSWRMICIAGDLDIGKVYIFRSKNGRM